MKDQIIKRIESLNGELELLGADHLKLTKILKDIETKIIFTKGKVSELSDLIRELEAAENIEQTEKSE